MKEGTVMIIQSTKVWLASQFLPIQIELEGSKIKAIHSYNSKAVDKDFGDMRIVPGFIDIHIHGGYGFDTNDAYESGLINLYENLPKEGVTSFLPTTITQSEEVLTKALQNVAAVKEKQVSGARILGVHFEGPYLNVAFKGAQPEECIVKPDVEQFKRYQEASNNLIKLITMACEKDEDYKLMNYLTSQDIVISLGHTGATYEEALLAVGNGAKSFTHVYNGMSRYHHRDVNVQGASLRFHDVYGEIIVDGNHANFAAVNNYMVAKGKEKVILITDALIGKGEPIGSEYIFGGHPIKIAENGSAYLQDGTGSLAGSTLLTNIGVKNIIEKVGLDWEYALNAASTNPATLLGLDNSKGYLRAGYDADIVVLQDDYNVACTFVLGEIAYENKE